MAPLISICIPSYNAAKFITATLTRFAVQTFDSFEVIVVDDESKDETASLVELFVKNDPRFRLILARKQGAAACRNQAFEQSKGDYVIFFDADDLVDENYLESQLRLINNRPESIVACKLSRFFNNDLTTSLNEELLTWQDLKPIDWLLIDNGKGLGMMQCGMFLIPRNLLDQAGLWDPTLSLIDDFDFFPRLFLHAETIIFNEETTVHYRSGISNSLSDSKGLNTFLSAVKALSKTQDLLLKAENSLRVKQVMTYFWSELIYMLYPKYQELYDISLSKLRELGVEKFKPLGMGGLTSVMNKLIGWKLTKRIKSWSKR